MFITRKKEHKKESKNTKGNKTQIESLERDGGIGMSVVSQ